MLKKNGKNAKEEIIISKSDLGIKAKEKKEITANPYYETVSYRYKIATVVSAVILIAFILIMLTVNSESITYKNFIFLVKDINTTFESDGIFDIQKSIRYNVDKNQQFALYKNGLAVAGNSDITVYNASGKQTFTGELHYSSPHLSVSDKYFLAYDTGGNEYAVYNSFAKLHSETTDYPISKAVIDGSGKYAVITKTKEYPSAVFLYDKNFNLVGKYLKDKYITDVALGDKELVIISAESENGDYYTEISVYGIGENAASAAIKENGLFPLNVNYYKDGGFCVVCDRALLFFDSEKKEISRYDFGVSVLSKVSFGNEKTALVLTSSTSDKENTVIVFDTSGKIIYNGKVNGKINDLNMFGEHVYLLLDTGIKRISSKGGEISELNVSAGAKKLLVMNESNILLCYSSYTQYVEIK